MEKAVRFRTVMNDSYEEHPSEDALERFLLQQSPDEELEAVETHFFACEACVNRLEVLEFKMRAWKLGCQDHLADEQRKKQQDASKKRGWLDFLHWRQLSWATGAAAACLAVFLSLSTPQSLNLDAERGNGTVAVSEWVPLHIRLGAHFLPYGPVTVRALSKSNGKSVWELRARVQDGFIEFSAPRFTSAGEYLIEVYSPSAGDPVGDLVLEHPVTVKPLY